MTQRSNRHRVISIITNTLLMQANLTMTNGQRMGRLQISHLRHFVARTRPLRRTKTRLFRRSIIILRRLLSRLRHLQLLRIRHRTTLITIRMNITNQRPLVIQQRRTRRVNTNQQFSARRFNTRIHRRRENGQPQRRYQRVRGLR